MTITLSKTLVKSHLLKSSKSLYQMQMQAPFVYRNGPSLSNVKMANSPQLVSSALQCRGFNNSNHNFNSNFGPKFPKISIPNSLSSNSHSPFSNPARPIFSSTSLSAKFQWHSCNTIENPVPVKENEPAVTVVLLGWLGSSPRHLRRYVELYNSKGFHAVTFVASVGDVLSFDLGRSLEERVGELTKSIATWAEEEEDGRERALVFHTFSNTGWLAYGAILDNLRGRHDLLMKIKGCIVDSGADPELNPKVWAAGFVAALLKKRSSLTSSTGTGKETSDDAGLLKTPEEEPLFIESVLLAVFEKLFSFLFGLPDVTERLRRVLSILTNDQPLCPQLYLYSTADKVIPWKSVEAFMEQQRKKGREVWSFNFGSSPHVDHYRTFSEIYSSQLLSFLQKCLVTVKLT